MPVQEARVHTGGPGTKDADQEYRRLAMAYDKFTSSKSDCIASVHLLGRQNRHGAYVDRKATCEVGKTQLAMLSEQPSSNTPCILGALRVDSQISNVSICQCSTQLQLSITYPSTSSCELLRRC